MAVTFEPVRKQRLSALITEQLKEAIVSGALAEGERLPPERELAERFGASRTSVQQAIHALEMTGLVTVRRGASGGAFVTKPDFGRISTMLHTMLHANRFELRQLYEARLIIEPGIAEIAAARAGEEDIAAMRALAAAGVRKGERKRNPIGRGFHYLLARSTGNDLLVMLVSSLLSVAEATPARVRPANAEHRHTSHELIVEAIERRDGATARRVTAEHITQLLEEITALPAGRRAAVKEG